MEDETMSMDELRDLIEFARAQHVARFELPGGLKVEFSPRAFEQAPDPSSIAKAAKADDRELLYFSAPGPSADE